MKQVEFAQEQADRVVAACDKLSAALAFPGGSVTLPQPSRAELLVSADEWVATAKSAIVGFAELADSGDRAGCKAAIRAFMASAQMIADRMLEACP